MNDEMGSGMESGHIKGDFYILGNRAFGWTKWSKLQLLAWIVKGGPVLCAMLSYPLRARSIPTSNRITKAARMKVD